MLLAVTLTACPDRPKPPAAATETSAPAARSGPVADATSAVRCGECHEVATESWRESAHARASSSSLFLAMRRELPADRSCDACHAPLAERLPSGHSVASEGVTCDVCHTAREATPARTGGSLTLELTDNVKYGPLCDARDHYFHRMGCSPLHQTATLCASCHQLYRPVRGGTELPVYTEYDEWKQTAYAEAGTPCQYCHMEGGKGEVAVGAGERPEVHGHGLLGARGRLRQEALSLALEVRPASGRLRVVATVENREAGHFVPTGVPGRRVVLEVRSVDARGTTVATEQRSYARTLVNDQGREVPWFKATRLASDNRLPPGEPRREEFLLAGPARGRVEATLTWVETSPELAAALGIASPASEQMVSASVPIGRAQTVNQPEVKR